MLVRDRNSSVALNGTRIETARIVDRDQVTIGTIDLLALHVASDTPDAPVDSPTD